MFLLESSICCVTSILKIQLPTKHFRNPSQSLPRRYYRMQMPEIKQYLEQYGSKTCNMSVGTSIRLEHKAFENTLWLVHCAGKENF